VKDLSLGGFMSKKLFIKRLIIVFACVLVLLAGGAVIFVLQINRNLLLSEEEVQASNLQKLAMVWGFAKYTHPVFLTGQRCWDEELLSLILVVRFADESEVNDILYEWFTGLGNDGFDDNESVFLLVPFYEEDLYISFLERVENSVQLSVVGWVSGPEYFSLGLRIDKNYLDSLTYDDEHANLRSLTPVSESYMKPMANLDWLTDESFLGNSLVSVFSRFTETPMVDRTNAPAFFSEFGLSDFSNESLHVDMDFKDANYRLLGLFRLWNTMNYFFPYLDIIDGNWNDLLLSHIKIMLEGTDRLSYELTLKSLASELHDAHIRFVAADTFDDGSIFFIGMDTFDQMFGQYAVSARLTEAEEQIVIIEAYYDNLLMPGDIVLKVNGIDINEIVANMLRYLPYPNEEKSLFYLTRNRTILRQHFNDTPMSLILLRDGLEIEVSVAVDNILIAESFLFSFPPDFAYMRLENNIGIINPSRTYEIGISHIMEYFVDTIGIVVDLRQYPALQFWDLIPYLVQDNKRLSVFTQPSQSIPGMFMSLTRFYSNVFRTLEDKELYLYENNVVVLTDESTISAGETTAMYLSVGTNVTVMGSNSIGANGDVQILPLPGGVIMSFSSLGVFTPESGQTQRIGLSPDIRINRTIAGIREGRDELLDAAIHYLITR